MKREEFGKKIGAGVILLLFTSTIGTIAFEPRQHTPQMLGILEYEPKSHDFGNMVAGESNRTNFDIWTSGGCCELIFNLTWNCSWVYVFPINGVTNGEHIPITVTVDTSGLDVGIYTCEIYIATNGGGDGIFTIRLNITSANHPLLVFSPQTYNFGYVPQNVTQSTTFDIWNGGNATLNYTLSLTKDWVTVTPKKGSSIGEHDPITVTINTHGLQNGVTYQCDIDIISNGGNDVFPITVTIGTIPSFEITQIKGGLFHTKAIIKNNGTADANDLKWKITLSGNGLIILGKESTGTISTLPVGNDETIASDVILGLGSVFITVTIYYNQALPVMHRTSAKLFLLYVKV